MMSRQGASFCALVLLPFRIYSKGGVERNTGFDLSIGLWLVLNRLKVGGRGCLSAWSMHGPCNYIPCGKVRLGRGGVLRHLYYKNNHSIIDRILGPISTHSKPIGIW